MPRVDRVLPIGYRALQEILTETFGDVVHVNDRSYAFPNEDYLIDAAQGLIKKNNRKGLSFGPKWDCDDFAIDFVNLIKKNFAVTSDSTAEGIAVGFVSYRDDQNGFHAIVWFLSPDSTVKFIEPQTGQLANLSEKETHSAALVWG